MNLFGSPNAYGGFDAPHAANADPETSHEAAVRMERSGKLNRHCEIVLAIVRRSPGTYAELWESANDAERAELGDAAALQKRLADLVKRGAIKRLPARACGVKGTSMQPVEAV